MKVLLITMYFPPAGGGGVQRPLKLATHLPALGIETHVLAPDDPKWLHRDDELRPPTQAFVHRARYLGPKARLPSEELRTLDGFDLALAKARVLGRRLLLPDASVTWAPTAIPAAVRIVKSEGIDAVITTSPPLSMNLIGAAVKRLTGVPWVADQRDSLVQNADRRFERKTVQAKEKALERVVRLVANSADGIVAVSDAIADELRAYDPAGPVRVIPNGSDFDDFVGLEYHPADRFRITHTGSFFGKRNPRAFLSALASSGLEDVVARFVGDFRSVDREWVQELDLGDRLELLDYLPHRRALELQRDSEANLLLLPDAAGRGQGRAEREDLRVPRGRAADPRRGADRRRRRRSSCARPAPGVVVAPDDEDGLREALVGLHARWKAGQLGERLPERRAAQAALAHDPRRGAGRAALEPRVTARASRAGSSRSSSSPPSFTCTFAKVQWNAAGSVFLADLTAGGFLLFYALDRLGRGGRPAPRTAAVLLAFLARLPARLPDRLLQPRDRPGARPVRQGPDEVAAALRLPDRRRDLPRAEAARLLLAHARLVPRRDRRQRRLRDPAAARRAGRAQPRLGRAGAAHPRREPDQHLRRRQRLERLPAERAHRRPEPPRRSSCCCRS